MEFEEFKRVRYKTPAFDFTENKQGFAFHKSQPGYSDISAHLPLLEYLASKCSHITEFGTRDGFSTCALMSGLQKTQGKLVSFDINMPSFVDEFKNMEDLPCSWDFRQRSTVDEDLDIEETDLLFVDSLHTHEQVRDELRLHAARVRKFIAFHDTYSHGEFSRDMKGREGILRAINEFVDSSLEWEQVYKVDFNHGLIVLEKTV